MTPNIRDLLSGMESISPNSKYQKAMTPDLLRCFAEYANDMVVNSMEDHAADLIIGAFFFAMRSCEFTMVAKITKTIAIRLGGIRFYTKERKLVPHNHPQLLQAHYVWICFKDQKNRDKIETRTQERSGDPSVCPVVRWGRVVQRVIRYVRGADKNTPLCAIDVKKSRSKFISQDFTLKFMRDVCRFYGGRSRFGFDPEEIGNKSIRSGAAMALFLTDHSSDQIMILGRWKSKAFLVYIRPQIIEWTRNFSSDMISFRNFFELCSISDKPSNKEREPEVLRVHYMMPRLIAV